MNQRGPSKSAIIFKENSDGWIYELFLSGNEYGVYLINPDGRRYKNLTFYIIDGKIRHLENGKMPSEFMDVFIDQENFADVFVREAFRVAVINEVIES